jgi:hypothetical protein
MHNQNSYMQPFQKVEDFVVSHDSQQGAIQLASTFPNILSNTLT